MLQAFAYICKCQGKCVVCDNIESVNSGHGAELDFTKYNMVLDQHLC